MKLIFRSEIDRLRAIAVGAVILYHAQITIFGHQPFKGGFIGIDTSLIGVKYKNTFYKFDCTNEGGFNEINYYKKVDGKWEWA
jgi:hypothetical protein